MKETNIATLLAAAFWMLSSIFLFNSRALASNEIRKKIAEADIFEQETLMFMEEHLEEKNILTYLAVRQRFNSLPRDKTEKLKKKVSGSGQYSRLESFLKQHLQEERNLMVHVSDIAVDIKPLKKSAPFTVNHRGRFKLSDLKPVSERAYFLNPDFEYTPSNLVKKDEFHWWNPEYAVENPFKEQEYDKTLFKRRPIPEPELQWTYEYEPTRLTNSAMVGSRKPLSLNEDNEIYTATHEGILLFRDNYRIFSIDMASGRKLWEYPSARRYTSEHYLTYRHTHQPASGNKFLVAGDYIYSELNGKLVALRLKKSGFPEPVWEKNMGEFTLSTKPIKTGNIIVVVLINPRGKLWACGFSADKGELLWNRFIGISSYTFKASSLHRKIGETLLIGTNHGVFFSLKPETGELVWVRRYTAKEYDLYKHWKKNKTSRILKNESILKYDTQFMEVGKDGLLYYKPRLSGNVYIVNSATGEMQEKILIDENRHYALRAFDSKIYFLNKAAAETANTLKVLDMETEKIIFEETLTPGKLRGVYFDSKEETVFKINSNIYFLQETTGVKKVLSAETSSESWLLEATKNNVLLESAERIEKFKLSGHMPEASVVNRRILTTRDRILEGFEKAASEPPSENSVTQLINKISSESELFRAGYFYRIIEENAEHLTHNKWRPVFHKLNSLYGQHVISHSGVDMRFSAYLQGKGVVVREDAALEKGIGNNDTVGEGDEFSARVHYAKLLAHKNVGPQNRKDFFFLLHYDRLLCVSETGIIFWKAEVLFKPMTRNFELFGALKNLRRKSFGSVTPEIFVFKDTVILNNGMTLVAFNLNDGGYKWSISSDIEVLNYFATINPEREDELFREYIVDRNYLSKAHIFSAFMNDKLIVFRNNTLYNINPETGFCYSYVKLEEMDEVTFMEIKEDIIYMYALKNGAFYEIDKNFKILNKFPVNREKTHTAQADPNIFFNENYFIFQFPERIVFKSRKDDMGNYEITQKTGYEEARAVVTDGHMVILNENLTRIINLGEKSDLSTKYSGDVFDYEVEEANILSETYFHNNKHIVVPLDNKKNIVLKKISLDSKYENSILAHVELYPDIPEEYAIGVRYMFFSGKADKTLYYLITFALYNIPEYRQTGLTENYRIDAETALIGINLENGSVEFEHIFPAKRQTEFKVYQGEFTYGLPQFIETQNFVIYNYAGKLIHSHRKQAIPYP